MFGGLKIMVETWFFYWIVKKILHFFLQKIELIYLENCQLHLYNFLKRPIFFMLTLEFFDFFLFQISQEPPEIFQKFKKFYVGSVPSFTMM